MANDAALQRSRIAHEPAALLSLDEGLNRNAAIFCLDHVLPRALDVFPGGLGATALRFPTIARFPRLVARLGSCAVGAGIAARSSAMVTKLVV
jgi:hypothetical protein